jgi:hypothetical protein
MSRNGTGISPEKAPPGKSHTKRASSKKLPLHIRFQNFRRFIYKSPIGDIDVFVSIPAIKSTVIYIFYEAISSADKLSISLFA